MDDPQNLGLYYIIERDITSSKEWKVGKFHSLVSASHYCENNTPKQNCEFLILYPNGGVYKIN